MKGNHMNHDDNPLISDRKCPLCGHEATFLPIEFGGKREFDCPQCKTFLISASIEARIINSPNSLRKKLSRKAIDTPPKMMLHICVINN